MDIGFDLNRSNYECRKFEIA